MLNMFGLNYENRNLLTFTVGANHEDKIYNIDMYTNFTKVEKSLSYMPNVRGGSTMSKKSRKAEQAKDNFQPLLDHGTEMLAGGAATVTGATIAWLLGGGPEALAIGGTVGKGIQIALGKVGGEISSRQLGPREEKRVGATLIIAAAEINRRLENGDALRDDGFFDEKHPGRSDAEEVAESVLLKVQREPEEMKLPYMGHFLSSIPFHPEISVQMAHQLSKIAEQLTYRQLCILKLSVVKDEYGLRGKDYRDHDDFGKDLYPVLYECAELYNKEYINFGGEANFHIGEHMDYGATIHRLTRARPDQMTLQGIGADLFNLMKLSLIPKKDIAPIAEQLK